MVFAPLLVQLHRFKSTLFQPNPLPWSLRQMELIDAELTTLLAEIRERRNELDMGVTGAHSLPDEILRLIFDFLVDFTDQDYYKASVKSLLSVLRVSRRWSRIASTTSHIWRGVDFDVIPNGFIPSWLDRCAATPLSIWTSSADAIILIRDRYPNFPAQVVRLTLREAWYFSSEYRDFLTSYTFPNVVELRIHEYPRPAIIFTPPTLSRFAQLRSLHIDCSYEFWANEGSLPTSLEDLHIHLYGFDDISASRLARALGSLLRLRRLVFKTVSDISSHGGDRMHLPSLEYVHLILNPHFHHILLDILPTFQTRPYHLLIREAPDELYFGGPMQLTSSIGAILHGHTNAFTSVRFTLGLRYPIMTLQGAEYLSVSIEEHSPFGERLAFVLQLLDLSCVRDAIITEEPSDRPCYYDLGDAYTLLTWVERLVIEGEVGPEASRLLIGLGGEGRRFLFPSESSYTVQWPRLSSIHLHDIDEGFFHASGFEAMRALGLAIWSIKSSGVPLRTVRVTKTTSNVHDFMQWRDFLPSVIVEEEDGVCLFVFMFVLVAVH